MGKSIIISNKEELENNNFESKEYTLGLTLLELTTLKPVHELIQLSEEEIEKEMEMNLNTSQLMKEIFSKMINKDENLRNNLQELNEFISLKLNRSKEVVENKKDINEIKTINFEKMERLLDYKKLIIQDLK